MEFLAAVIHFSCFIFHSFYKNLSNAYYVPSIGNAVANKTWSSPLGLICSAGKDREKTDKYIKESSSGETVVERCGGMGRLFQTVERKGLFG